MLAKRLTSFSSKPRGYDIRYPGARKVKVAAIVGVKDEVELIQPCLETLGRRCRTYPRAGQ
jgi:hypothetical protein